MKERPLLLNRDLRQLVRDGRKTQTRRPVKPQPQLSRYGWTYTKQGRITVYGAMLGRIPYANWDDGDKPDDSIAEFSPLGIPGDRLYLQEPYRIDGCKAGPNLIWGEYLDDGQSFTVALTDREWELFAKRKQPYRPTSARCMYRPLARDVFEVERSWVERLNEISNADIVAEGIAGYTNDSHGMRSEIVREFVAVWDSIYAADGFGWDTNCWVWCAAFRRIDGRS